jgi:hypothetical protein
MEINYWAVLVAAVASMVIGSVWYGPLFGKKFIAAMGMDKWTPEQQAAEKKKMGMLYFMQFVASLIMFYVLARFIFDLGQMSVSGSLMVALWVWIGFIVPTKLGDAIWGGNKTLFWITSFGSLVTLLATGAIIGAWK